MIDRNVIKFGFYGFLKNLQFFEPFIYLYFLAVGLSYFQIGLMLSIREVSTYVFEIPTGVIADTWGKKRSMLLCFVFYMISFTIYYLSSTFLLIAAASLLFGLGEAFRQGTHKAIIFDYLDRQGIPEKKSEVYGFTSSVAKVGSALSAIIAGGLMLWFRDYHLIFLFSIVPYAAAFLLIFTYPPEKKNYRENQTVLQSMRTHVKNSFGNLLNIGNLHRTLVNSAVYDGVFKGVRDFVQPVVRNFMLAAPVLVFLENEQTRETIVLSLLYLLISIIGALCLRNAYRLEKIFASISKLLNILFVIQAGLLLLMGWFTGLSLAAVFVVFLILNGINSLRRPVLLSYLVDQIDDKERATMLSIESQLKAFTVVLVAPLLGWTADFFSLSATFYTAGVIMLLLNLFFLKFKK